MSKLGWFEIIYPAVLVARKFYAPKKKEKPAPPATGRNPTEQEKANSAEMAERREKREQQQKAKDGLKIAVNSAKITCTLCTNPVGTLMVTDPNPTACNQPIATTSDKQKTNLMFTGTCSKSPNSATPCKALIQPAMWQDTGSLKVQDKPPLLQQSTIKCLWGGVDIKFMNSGQMKPPIAFDSPGPKREVKPDDSVNIRISVFFDGTANNKYNTECRLEYQKKKSGKRFDAKKASIYQQQNLKSGGEVKDEDSSYENDFSNVARLFKYYEENLANPKNLTSCIYVEGVGTNNFGDDDIIPQGLGYDILTHTGVLEKVKTGCESTAIIISQLANGKLINSLTIDVFGFSRGAAAARNFLHEIKKDYIPERIDYYFQGVQSTVPPLPAGGHLGYLLNQKGVIFNLHDLKIIFAGLFDTVASYGVYKGDNVNVLNLKAVSNAKHVLHLTAMDERRANFPLITIKSKGLQFEKKLPGVHCDIGGSYNPEIVEDKSAIFVGDLDETILEMDNLILLGWFNRQQLTIDRFLKKTFANLYVSILKNGLVFGKYKEYRSLHGIRENVKQDYSFIPLHIMGKAATDKTVKIKFKAEFEKKFVVPQDLNYVNKRLNDYVFKGFPPMKFVSRADLDRLIEKERAFQITAQNIKQQASLKLVAAQDVFAKKPQSRIRTEIDSIIEKFQTKDLDPNKFDSNPHLKMLMEDHIALLYLRNNYLHVSHNCSWGGSYVKYYDPYSKSIMDSDIRFHYGG